MSCITKNTIHVTTQIAKLLTDSSQRYALDVVKVIPSVSGVAILATDGHVACRVNCDGNVNEPCFVPRVALPSTKQEARKGKWIEIENIDQKPHFPDVDGVIPHAPELDTKFVTLDTALLNKVSAALNSDENYVTLFVTGPDKPVLVCGEHGVGVVMPNVDGTDDQTFRVKRNGGH